MGEISEAIRRAQVEARPVVAATNPSTDVATDPAPVRARILVESQAVSSRMRAQPQPRVSLTLPDPSDPAIASLAQPTSSIAQAFRRLAFRIRTLSEERNIRSLAVLSALPSEGKTTVACNLAIELARMDQSSSICLVDMDLRRPRIASCFGLSPTMGIESVLVGESTIEQCAIHTDFAGLDILPVRKAMADPDRHLSSDRLRRCFEDLEARYSMVLIDTPPLGMVADANPILKFADGGILIASAKQSPSRRVARVCEQLPTDKLLGTVLNLARADALEDKYMSSYSVREDDDDDPKKGP